MSNEFPAKSISNRSLRSRKIMLVAMISLLVLISLLFVASAVDFNRWAAQWQVWWGLRQAEETAVTQATVISYYQENEDNFIHYRYSTLNGQQFEKTEQVKNSIYQQADAGDPIMVDFAVDNPNVAGIIGNIDPFSGLLAIIIMVGLILIRMAGKRRHYSPTPDLSKKVSELDQENKAQPDSTQRSVSRSWTGIELRLVVLLLFIFQFILLYLLMTK